MCVEVFCNSFVRSVTNKIKHQLDTQKKQKQKTIKLKCWFKTSSDWLFSWLYNEFFL